MQGLQQQQLYEVGADEAGRPVTRIVFLSKFILYHILITLKYISCIDLIINIFKA